MFITTAGGGMIAGTLLGGLMGGSSSGGSTQQTKNPWEAAVPWLTSNLQTGQNLQGYYQANPFNPLQMGAYGNLLAGNDYINQMVPGLLSQMSQQTGYDRNHPGRAAPFMFPAMQPGAQQPMSGLLAPSMTGATSAVQTGAATMPQPAPGPAGNPYVGLIHGPGDLFRYAGRDGGGSGGDVQMPGGAY